MLADSSGVMIGEDVLSTDSSYATSPLTISSSSPSTSISHSSTSGNQQETGILNFFRRRSWFGFGGTAEELKKKRDTDTVNEIMKCFRNNDVVGMEKFIQNETKNFESNSEALKTSDESSMWWDDEGVFPRKSELREVPFCKNTPHPKKGVSKLPPRVLKAVRFDVENTPEDRENRPFTPLFTSTPKHPDIGSDSEDELRPLRECDSNTVLPPTSVLNNTSSILLANTSVMMSLNKCRQETMDALCRAFDKNSYKICYDDTDEEEVEECKEGEEAPTSPRVTFVVEKEDSEPSNKTVGTRDQSFDTMDTSTDSSIILNLDCIDNYIQRLDDEIAAAHRFAREKDMERAKGALLQARNLQERFGQMNEAINDMCSKLPEILDHIEDHKSQQNISSVFEDSQWREHLGSEAGSFDLSVL
ncbi:hypothetical protein GCK72_014300 [Caenorhabditis remanei]|nr:hypothetical protein GCK72_014300 [Caenorhabditis remanei]KAF1757843.1 hypothetical protein GCK72_014300 [Caenorhabditis remanei]